MTYDFGFESEHGELWNGTGLCYVYKWIWVLQIGFGKLDMEIG